MSATSFMRVIVAGVAVTLTAFAVVDEARAADDSVHQIPVTYNDTGLSQALLLGGDYDDYGRFIFCATGGSCELIGTSIGISGKGTGITSFQLDPAGKLMSGRVYDPSGKNILVQAVPGDDGGTILVINSFSSFGDMASYPGRGLLLKLSPDGKPSWARLVAAPYKNDTLVRLHSAAQTADGSLIVTGACISGDSDERKNDIAVMKFTSDGKPVWHHCYGFDHNTYGGRLLLEADGRIRITADYAGAAGSNAHVLLVTLSADGAFQQASTLVAKGGSFYAVEIAHGADGGTLISGGFLSGDGSPGHQVAVAWLGQDGSVKTARGYGTDGGLMLVEARPLADGLALLGYTGYGPPKSHDDVGDAIAFIVDAGGDIKASAKAVARRNDSHGFSFGEFQGIEQLSRGHYRLLGDTAAFSTRGDFDLLTALWTPAAKPAPLITSTPVEIVAATVAPPKVFDGSVAIPELDVGRIDMADIKTDATH